jgi:hypothetical protein
MSDVPDMATVRAAIATQDLIAKAYTFADLIEHARDAPDPTNAVMLLIRSYTLSISIRDGLHAVVDGLIGEPDAPLTGTEATIVDAIVELGKASIAELEGLATKARSGGDGGAADEGTDGT